LLYAGDAALPLLHFLGLGNLPGLYALVFFCMNATQHLAHIHFDGLVWIPPSVSLSRWHDVQNLKLMSFCIL